MDPILDPNSKAKLVVAGNISVVDSVDAEGRSDAVTEIPKALVIQFPDTASIREAMEKGFVEFDRL